MTEPLVTLPEPPLFRGEPKPPAPATPISLAQVLLEQGVDPVQLAQLMDCEERYRKTQAEIAYNVAMKAAQMAMPSVVRNAKNTSTGSLYATLEAVSDAVDPVINEYGFSLSYGTADSPLPNHVRITCDCRHDAGHKEKHQLDCPYDTVGPKGTSNKTPIQGMGSSLQYGRRYLKMLIFDVVCTDEDNDGQSQSQPISEEQAVTIREWLVATSTNEKRFLEWAECDSIARFPATKFEAALDFFRRKSGR